ncbi:MAG: hypothetical protein R3300_20325 [Candidatus Promineifilaceae bacterium]|nr:hypothetical protein [Candidatus Promineifilaceae bacterium]
MRTTWPSNEDPGPPFYARTSHTIYNDGEWAAIAFYRDPACVTADFNLLIFFDPPTAFGCQLTVEGASLWQGEPLVGAPKIATMSGSGVPIWFVPVAALNQATQDGELKIGELAELDGLLVGYADQFKEVLHPVPLPPALGGGGHPHPKTIQNAHGWLVDGRSFELQITDDVERGTTPLVRIEFRQEG